MKLLYLIRIICIELLKIQDANLKLAIMGISEKTLEMNVSEHCVRVFRIYYPTAFLEGVTLRHEKRHGLDVSMNLPGEVKIVGLQFKKPESKSGNIYRFRINSNKGNDQHLKLYFWSFIFNEIFGVSPIRYAFPTFYDIDELSNSSPNFLGNTYFVDPLEMPSNILNNNFHVVEINKNNNSINVFSNSPSKVKKFSKGESFIKEIIEKEAFINFDKSGESIEDNIVEKIPTFKKKVDKIDNQYLLKLSKTNWSFPLKGIILDHKKPR